MCTINNDDIAATLSLDKVVTNNNGGTAVETDWTLTAAGPTPLTGVGRSATHRRAARRLRALRIGRPPGYAPSAWTCTGATSFTDTTVTVALDQTVVCTINNDDIAATLSLDKVVTNNNGGTAVETDWTLTATPDAIAGQDPVTGAGGVPPTDVLPGTYTLTETGDVPGYAAAPAFSCIGATSFTDTTVTVALDQTVVCTINNDDIAATLSLDKVVTNDNGGTAVETDWTLTAAGPTPLTGVGGVPPTDVLPGVYDLVRIGRPARVRRQRLSPVSAPPRSPTPPSPSPWARPWSAPSTTTTSPPR